MADLIKENEKNFPVRRYGRTNYAMPVFSCGGMRFQYGWALEPGEEIPEESQKNVEACIERALDLGINHIETARGYGTSELQLGKALSSYNREKMIIQTKVGPSDNVQQFKDDFELSFKNLQLPYIDFLSIHGINNQQTFDQTMKKGGCLAILGL